MYDRRQFLQTALAALAVTGTAKLAASESAPALPSGLIYSTENPGKWDQKVASHAPQVTVEGHKVSIKTAHIMTEKHYIVRHTVVNASGNVLGEKTFYPTDEEALSSFEITEPGAYYATSFCNLHDLWVTPFNV